MRNSMLKISVVLSATPHGSEQGSSQPLPVQIKVREPLRKLHAG